MQFIKDYVIDVDADPDATEEEEIPKMQSHHGIDYNVFDKNIQAQIGGDEPLDHQRGPETHGQRVNDSKVMKQDKKGSALPSFGKPKIPKKRTPEYPEGNTGA